MRLYGDLHYSQPARYIRTRTLRVVLRSCVCIRRLAAFAASFNASVVAWGGRDTGTAADHPHRVVLYELGRHHDTVGFGADRLDAAGGDASGAVYERFDYTSLH